MHYTEHDLLELWMDDDYLLSVCWTNECFYKLIIFVNVSLLIMVTFFVLIFFIMNSPLQFLYRVVGTCDDHESLFVGAEGQQ